MNPKPRLFIGSAKEDVKIAEAIKNKLQSSGDVEATLWTDKTVFRLSGITLMSLIEALNNYDFSILVATPDPRIKLNPSELPVPRDNVIYEMGLFAGRLGYERVFIVIPENVGLHLATDLEGLNFGHFDPHLFKNNPDGAISRVCEEILLRVKELGIDRILAYHEINTRKYGGISTSFLTQISFSSIISRSPFQFTHIADDNFIFSAEQEIFLAAQNHFSILCGNLSTKAHDLIFSFLKKDPSKRRVRFLFCDPEYEEGIKVWNWVNAEVDDWPVYKNNLNDAIKEMKNWISEARTKNLNLEARKARFIPLSVTFIDPDGENASLVVMPHVFEKASGKRPCHYITRKHSPEVFSIYYENYNRIYNLNTASAPL